MAIVRGIAFPFQQGDLSFPKEATDEDVIRASVIQIVTTGRGERAMRPGYGCDAFAFIFENNTEEFRIFAEREIRIALATWEPRVVVEAVQIEDQSDKNPGQIFITIHYRIVLTNEQDRVTIAGGA